MISNLKKSNDQLLKRLTDIKTEKVSIIMLIHFKVYTVEFI